jgi:hypothetical protein
VYDYKSADIMSYYTKTFDIFDLINVARIHSATSLSRNVTENDLFQLRTLANSAEFGYNYNLTQHARSIHTETFSGAILSRLNKTITFKRNLKFCLLAGSSDTFLACFSLANLTAVDINFFYLHNYASTMSPKLFSADTVKSCPENPGAPRCASASSSVTAQLAPCHLSRSLAPAPSHSLPAGF